MYRSTREFIDALQSAGELVRIEEPVSSILEVAQFADAVSKSQARCAPSASAERCDPRFHAMGGSALLFEHVLVPTPDGGQARAPLPLLINGWGSYRRMEMALGCHDDALGVEPPHTPGGFAGVAQRIADLTRPEPPRSLRDALAKAKQFAPLLSIGPKRKRGGACHDVVVRGQAIDLTTLPIIRCWPHDGDFAALGYPPDTNAPATDSNPLITPQADHLRGRYVTLAGVHTIHADDAGAAKPASHNIGMYRVQLLGPRHVAMHWHMHHDGAAHWRSWKRAGKRMPVAIALGGESVLPYAATAPLPPGISELLMAGFLNRGGIALTRAKTVPLWVPANADIVIEGWVSSEAGHIGWDPRDDDAGPLGPGAVFEGPFGDHTGFYSLPDRYPIVEVTALTMRRDAVYPTTIVGLPPQEDYFLGKATERIFFPLLKTLIHDIEDYDLPMFGAFHNCAVIQVRKAYPLQARRVMHAVWGAGQMAWTKTLFVVDETVDPHDLGAVMDALARHCNPARDLELVHGPLDILDHAAPHLGAGGKIGFDCTPAWAGEEVGGIAIADPAPLPDPAPTLERIREVEGVMEASMPTLAPGWLFLKTTSPDGRDVVERALETLRGVERAPHLVVALGPGVDIASADTALFHWVANMDPSRDLIRDDGRPARVGFDATPKSPAASSPARPIRDWPPVLEMDPHVVERVRERLTRLAIVGGSPRTNGSRPA